MGAAVALAATGMQLIVGLWVLASLSPVSQSRLMGRDFVGTSGLVVAVLLTFWLLHRLANACLTDASVPQIRGTMLILLLIVVMMTATLRRAENGRHQPEAPARNSSHGVRRLLYEASARDLVGLEVQPTASARDPPIAV
jgi:hypothetical protein